MNEESFSYLRFICLLVEKTNNYPMKIFNCPKRTKLILLFCMISALLLDAQQNALKSIKYIDYFFENASPLSWEMQGDTIIKISLLADYERDVLNRQTDHWYFRLEAAKGTQVSFILSKMVADIYNGNLADKWWNFKRDISCYISYDLIKWEALATSRLPGYELLVEFVMKGESVYVARIPPYTEKDLERLKKRIVNNHLVKIIPIGHTVEKRPLEIIRIGNPEAEYSILLRARAHPWEPGGNWVIEGLIDDFLKNYSEREKDLNRICYYIMPMANKDGVSRGMTRFNVAGKDLNRNWLSEADSIYAPENFALEKFLYNLIRKGHKPVLAVDFHNDDAGDISLSIPKDNRYLKKMELLGQELRAQTWFSQRLATKNKISGGGTMADGMYLRFDIDALTYELNANYIESLKKIPEASDWQNLGAKLNSVFVDYLNKISAKTW